MTKPVVIVESPNKIKKLRELMGDRYIFTASIGHIRDLPTRSMGVSAPDYEPTYVISDDKQNVVAELKKRCQGREVILATDPDREGEAIAWHLAEVLQLRSPKRVAFDQLTQSALAKAFANPRGLNRNLVNAYAGRRVLDRLVGFKVSKALSQTTGVRYSAGRVQSPALRLVVDREREIESFVPKTHFGVQAKFLTETINWVANWDTKPFLPADDNYMMDRTVADEVATIRHFIVGAISTKEIHHHPKGAFTTSTLQQAASVALKIKPKESMAIAQRLFADGLITYMRTDNPNVSTEATAAIWSYLKEVGKSDYIPYKAFTYEAKSGAQEAHEAIRPTDFKNIHPNQLEGRAAAIYRLIWQRAVASQMKPARFEITTVTLNTDKTIDEKAVTFIARGKVLLFDGWLSLTTDKTEEGKVEPLDDQQLPSLTKGQSLTSQKTEVLTKKTQPPPRYTQASLIKKLESEGIGRPSTYASIVDRLFSQRYITEDKHRLQPLERGRAVCDALVNRFSFVKYDYTRAMETSLDAITQGKTDYLSLVRDADNKLDGELSALGLVETDTLNRQGKRNSGRKRLVISANFLCHKCAKPLIKRPSKKSKHFWWGCSGFPGCRQMYYDDNGKPQYAPNPEIEMKRIKEALVV